MRVLENKSFCVSLQDSAAYAVQASFEVVVSGDQTIDMATAAKAVEVFPIAGYTEEIYVDPYGPTFTYTYPTSYWVETSMPPDYGYTHFGTGTYVGNAPYTLESYYFTRAYKLASIGQTIAKWGYTTEGDWHSKIVDLEYDVDKEKAAIYNMSNVTLSEMDAYIAAGYGADGWWYVPGYAPYNTKHAWHSYSHYAIEKGYSRENFLTYAIAADTPAVSEDPMGFSYYYNDEYIFTPGYFTVPPTYGDIEELGLDITYAINADTITYTPGNALCVFDPSYWVYELGSYNRVADKAVAETSSAIDDWWWSRQWERTSHIAEYEYFLETVEDAGVVTLYYKTGYTDDDGVHDYHQYLSANMIRTTADNIMTASIGGHPLTYTQRSWSPEAPTSGLYAYPDRGITKVIASRISVGKYLLLLGTEAMGITLLEGQALKVPADQDTLFTDWTNTDYGDAYAGSVYSRDQYNADEVYQEVTFTAAYTRTAPAPVRFIKEYLPDLTPNDMQAAGLTEAHIKEWARLYRDGDVHYNIAIDVANYVGETAPVGGITIYGVIIADDFSLDVTCSGYIKYGFFETYETLPTRVAGAIGLGGLWEFTNTDYIEPGIRGSDPSYHKTRIDYWNWEIVTP